MNEPPFGVPDCCPACLFPRAYSISHEEGMDEGNQDSSPAKYSAPPKPEYYSQAE